MNHFLLPDAARDVSPASRSARYGSFAMEVALDTPNLSLLAQRMLLADGRDLEQVVGSALYAKLAASADLMTILPWTQA